ncbi:hypothetical protein [Dyella choica]|uniref:hypothetical protein n=1 Tax=Dyella choica TaxID=1927959 RepID=UPI0013158ABC|nr:hypothetical protein [Dyella choica]
MGGKRAGLENRALPLIVCDLEFQLFHRIKGILISPEPQQSQLFLIAVPTKAGIQ